ncbi:MAG TPA: acetate--CoA ligase family protein [Candidatus Polarisedimenticolia bacterium]|jgi:acetyltransferase|nr:acetate--CoA ligase family protein [Candidatus Polarisedimenticolia bacterium]
MEGDAHALARLFDPRGVAILGASQAPGKYGTILLQTLIEEGFAGAIHPVNPKGGALLGRPFLKSLDDAHGPVDVALVVRPAPEVPAAIQDVARRRIPFAIVYAAGFSEHGEEGLRLERDMVATAAAGGTRIVGPNCMNIFSAPARLNLSAIVPFPEGGLGFLSASGNLGYALAREAMRRPGVGFSRFVSAGNQADLALDDYLDYLRADPHTRAVLVFVEGFARGRGRAFLEAVEGTAAEKPVLVLRGGRTRAGRRSARSHTGALAGEAEALAQALEQAGAVLVDRADEALSIAQAFLTSPLPAGPAVALVGEGGGHATLTSDAASEAGLRIDPLPEGVVAALRAHLPPFAAIVSNPVELAGRSEYDVRAYENVLDPILDWPGCDQVILFGGYALYDEALAGFLDRRRRETRKPILIHDLYADEERAAFAPLRRLGLPLYASSEIAARAGAALARGGRARERAIRTLQWRRAGRPAGDVAPLPPDLRAAIDDGRRRPERALSEDEAARLLAHFGVPVLPARLAGDEESAVDAAASLGFPVVLKVHDPAVVHKSDAGGVHLDLRTPEEVRQAYRETGRSQGAARPSTSGRAAVRLTPFRRGGVETIAGARRDEHLGPVLLFGTGGTDAESVRDVALRTIPCPRGTIDGMIGSTGAGRRLAGGRGRPAADRSAVAATLEALARLLLSVAEVADAEVNPLLCSADGAVALDARVILHEP